jgi:4-amino-4-deoxy-L-arabinose transferase-like glycosyltransferase
VLRAWALTHGGSGHDAAGPSFGYLVITFAVGALVLAGATTLHLAHFPVRRWPVRVLALAAAITVAEVVTSVVLIAVGREPLGTTGRAAWHDLPAIALTTALWRLVPLAVFALLLAGVVQLVRTLLARRSRHRLGVAHRQLIAESRPGSESR